MVCMEHDTSDACDAIVVQILRPFGVTFGEFVELQRAVFSKTVPVWITTHDLFMITPDGM